MKFNFREPIWPSRSTPEDLEMDRSITKVIKYDNYIIAICYSRLEDEYFDAVYVYSGEGRTCEDEVLLEAIGSPTADEGHSIEGAIATINAVLR